MHTSKIILLLSFVILFAACKKESTPTTSNNGFEPTSTDALISFGSFESKAHATSGSVELYQNDDEFTLSITNLSSDDGPDLRVYLSENESDNNFLDLGSLQATSGNFSYTFDLGTNVSTLNHVLIWCEDFSINFGSAVLN